MRGGGELVLPQGIFVGKVRLWQGEHGLEHNDIRGVRQLVQVTLGELNLTRMLAVLVETNHDGMVWCPRVAPFGAFILLPNPSEEAH